MAIEKDKLLEIINNSEADAEARADTLLKLVNEDMESQLSAIKINREAIKNEKTEETAKRKAAEEQAQSFKEQMEQLKKQLEASSPDEVKKVYEQQMQDAANIHEKKVSDLNELINAQKGRIAELEKSQLKLQCMEEFNKSIVDKHISPDVINEFADFVLGQDCYKFDNRPIGEGKTVLATKDGLTIENAVKAALETSFGKRCVTVSSSGGGAEGGAKATTTTNNPFITGNITEQARLYREDKALYDHLKAQAGK